MNSDKVKKVSWFSAGVSSAIATKLALEEYPDLEVTYIDIDDQHPDSLRFVKDCEKWFNKEILILKSPYKNVENVVRQARYINGVAGARCTKTLKRTVRQTYEQANIIDTYFWGMDCTKREVARAERLKVTMPQFEHKFPLIEKGIDKPTTHQMLSDAGIQRPLMYELGFPNNNCLGCVKGGKGYWNHIREHFPDVFEARAKLEREIGASCINGAFLDELSTDSGHKQRKIEVEDCGILCQNNII